MIIYFLLDTAGPRYNIRFLHNFQQYIKCRMRLQDFKVVYICPDHNEKYHTRKLHMDNLLKSMGFKDIVHYKSGTEAYPQCLSLATIGALEKYIDEPILLLEDDIECTGESTDINVPDDVDAVYVGISRTAGHPIENRNVYFAQFEHYSTTQVRVINMLTAHAIFYKSKMYKQAVVELLKREYKTFVNDISISRIQPKYKILAMTRPLFFQSNKFNENPHFNVEASTKVQIFCSEAGWFTKYV